MKIYLAQDWQEFVLCLGYKGDSIKDYFLSQLDDKAGDFRLTSKPNGAPEIQGLRPASEPWDITFAETGLETDTGGRLHRVRQYVGDGTFGLTYADGLSNIDLAALLAFHKSHGKLATVTAVRPVSTLGILEMADGQQIAGFREKPKMDHLINGGFFLFERDVLPRLAADGQLMGFNHDGFWACMDTYKDNITLNELWSSRQAPWKLWDDDGTPLPLQVVGGAR
jgi:glucose-1-phosphate cytidylyltransferase